MVRMEGKVSTELTVSTDSPQGCCLSPKLFTLYIHDCVLTRDDTIVLRYADDNTVLGLIRDRDEEGYRNVVKDIIVYGEDNDLILKKTIRSPKLNVAGSETKQQSCSQLFTA